VADAVREEQRDRSALEERLDVAAQQPELDEAVTRRPQAHLGGGPCEAAGAG
jgi:hypothetical protein